MEQYTALEHIPLKWHKLIMYFLIPLACLMTITRLPTMIDTMNLLQKSGLGWLGAIDIIYSLTIVCVYGGAMVGLIRRNWVGVRCLLAAYCAQAAYNLLMLAAFSALGLDIGVIAEESVSSAISSLIGLVLNWIYYQKRRLIFYPPPPKAETRTVLPRASSARADEIICPAAPPVPPRKPRKPAPRGVVIALVVAVVVACALAVMSCVLAVRVDAAHKENRALVEENGNLSERVATCNEELDRCRGAASVLQERNRKLNAMQDEFYFWHNNAVMITAYGEKYHRYDCRCIKNSLCWICNVKTATLCGYAPCSVCNPPSR